MTLKNNGHHLTKFALYTGVVLLSLMQVNCVGSANFYQPPPGTIEYGSGAKPIDPDQLRVDGNKYPSYSIKEDILPPKPDVCRWGNCEQLQRLFIVKSDVWQVTHVFRNLYIIESKSYYDRVCHYLNRENVVGFDGLLNRINCGGIYDFGVYITPDGTVSGGWAVLPGPGITFSERQTYLNPNPKYNVGWPSGIAFERHDRK